MPELTPVTTVRLGEHLPLLDLLPDAQPLAWVRGGEGLIGWGNYATTTVSGPHRFADARHWWQKQLEKLAIDNTVHGSGTGPVLFASFSFSPEDVSVLVVPQVVVGTKGGKSWMTWIGSSAQPVLQTAADLPSNGQMKWDEEPQADALWKERVSTAVSRIRSGDLDKVVLARDITITSKNAIDPRAILNKLAVEYPTTWKFATQVEMAHPHFLVDQGQQFDNTLPPVAGNLQIEGTGVVEGMHILPPDEEHAIIAPAACRFDDQFLIVGTFERPFICLEHRFQDIQWIGTLFGIVDLHTGHGFSPLRRRGRGGPPISRP